MKGLPGLVVRFFLLICLVSLFIPSSGYSSDEETKWMAHNIYHESRGEPYDGKVAVAIVTINRVRSEMFPNTIKGVVIQPSQFSWYNDGLSDTPTDTVSYNECLEISKYVISLWKIGMIDILIRQKGLDGVKWYHNETVEPKWSDHYQFVAKIGGHFIYKDV